MDIVRFRDWVLECDPEATRKAYAVIDTGGADKCSCSYCKNFAAQRESVYPLEMLELFKQLGIDYRKEVEVWKAGLGTGMYLYVGWFHFIGRIQSPELEAEQICENFKVSFCIKSDLAAESLQGYPLVQIDFFTELPWVLQETPEPE